jgi:hypothetical protein
MRLVRAKPAEFVFQMTARERGLFLEVLRHFPLVPLSHHQIRRSSPADSPGGHERLLREAMATWKQDHKGRVQQLISNTGRFVARSGGWRIAFSREEMEWLLQVLNDVRVGSWLRLGCPDPDEGRAPQVTEANAPHLFLMELSGHFQCALLDALDQSTDAV